MKKEGVIVFLVLTLFTLLISAVNVRADIVDFLGRDQITGYGVFDAVGGLFNKLFGGEAVGGQIPQLVTTTTLTIPADPFCQEFVIVKEKNMGIKDMNKRISTIQNTRSGRYYKTGEEICKSELSLTCIKVQWKSIGEPKENFNWMNWGKYKDNETSYRCDTRFIDNLAREVANNKSLSSYDKLTDSGYVKNGIGWIGVSTISFNPWSSIRVCCGLPLELDPALLNSQDAGSGFFELKQLKDMDKDGSRIIDIADFNALNKIYKRRYYDTSFDYDKDGKVGPGDYQMLIYAYGQRIIDISNPVIIQPHTPL